MDLSKTFNIGPEKVEVATIKYSTDTYTEFSLDENSELDAVLRALDRMDYEPGLTYTADGLKHARYLFRPSEGGREHSKKVVVLITDGKSNQHTSLLAQEANRLKYGTGAAIFAIGIGSDLNEEELIIIASQPVESYYHKIESYEALDSIKQVIAELICYLPDPETTPAPPEIPPPPRMLHHCVFILIYIYIHTF